MKGMVFTEFLEMVEEVHHPDTADKIIQMTAAETEGVYAGVGTYPHQDLLGLVEALGSTLGVSSDALLFTFGRHLFGRFRRDQPHFFVNVEDTFTFLRAVDSYVHVEVRKLYPGADPPRFEHVQEDVDRLRMKYRSTRPFASLAQGLIAGCIDFFGEPIELRRESCCKRADQQICADFLLTRLPGPGRKLEPPTQMRVSDHSELAHRRLVRERRARKEAELLLEAKSRDLYVANLELRSANEKIFTANLDLMEATDNLETLVSERTEELALARDEALAASRAKSTFLANMSHELRSPLTAIIGYSEMIQEEAEDGGYPQLAQDSNRIETAGKHLLAVINDVLDISKVEAGKMVVHQERFSVRAVLGEVVDTLELMATRNGNVINIDCPEDIGSMFSDLTKVRQSLLNLIGNAAKFTKDGEVRVAVFPENDSQVIFLVGDTGIGLSNTQMQDLFTPFTQADESTSRSYGGTGLGLAITKHYAELLGGKLKVESALGEGSCFSLTLPRKLPA